jgi:hypothetical protein
VVWCGAPKSCIGKDAHVSICTGVLASWLCFCSIENGRPQKKEGVI